MAGKKRLAALLAVAGLMVLAQRGVVARAQPNGSWSSYQGGPSHLGAASGVRPGFRAGYRVAPSGDARLSGAAVGPGLAVSVGPKTLVGFDPATGDVLWSVDRAAGPIVPPAMDLSLGQHGIVVYTEGADRSSGAVVAIDPSTRQRLWRVPLSGSTRSAPALFDGRAYLGGADGTVYAIDAGTGTVTWRARARGAVVAAVAVADGRVFVVSENDTSDRAALQAFRADTGKIAWSFAPSRLPVGATSPTVSGGLVYAGFGDGTVRAIDEVTGVERWHQAVRIDFSPLSSPALADGSLFVLDRDGGLYKFDAKTGRRGWDFQFRGTGDWAAPIVSAGFAIVGLDDGTLAAVNTTTGHLAWETDLGTGPLGPLAVAGDRLLVASVGGRGGLSAFGNDPRARLIDRASPTRLNFVLAVVDFVGGAAIVLVVLVFVFGRLSRRMVPLPPPGPAAASSRPARPGGYTG